MALLGNFLCCLLVAWLCRSGLGVPLAPADRAPAVGEWTDRDCTGRWRGSVKSRRCVGGWAQDAATLVTVAQGQTARSEPRLGCPVGASTEGSLLGVCLHPGSGLFSSQGKKV